MNKFSSHHTQITLKCKWINTRSWGSGGIEMKMIMNFPSLSLFYSCIEDCGIKMKILCIPTLCLTLVCQVYLSHRHMCSSNLILEFFSLSHALDIGIKSIHITKAENSSLQRSIKAPHA